MISLVQRKKIILDKVNLEGYVQVSDLAEALNVTQATIRSDLRAMEKEGLLFRVHGSAMSKNPIARERTTLDKININYDAKSRIGRAAQRLVQGDETIMLLPGSTVYAFAEQLNAPFELSVFTTALNVAQMLASRRNISVKVLGGTVDPSSMSVHGEFSEEVLNNIVCSYLFFGADGISSKSGITCATVEEAIFMQRLMKTALKSVLLCDSSKIGRVGAGRICWMGDVDILITDASISKKDLKDFETNGVDVIIAD